MEAVRRRSRQLLAAYGRVQPPFLPGALAALQGIREIRRTDLPWDACLIPATAGDGFVVEVCKYHPVGRQHFSVAHEIGHTFLIEQEPSLRAPRREIGIEGNPKHNLAEKLCDLAAVELLLPLDAFTGDVAEVGPSIESLPELARRYRASLLSTARRFVEASVWKCYVIVWHRPEGKLQAKNVFGSASASRLYPQQILIGPDSTVHEALRTGDFARRRERMVLGGEEQAYYTESMRLGRGDLGQALTIVVLEPHAGHRTRRPTRSAQFSLFSLDGRPFV
jgi:hypothetical protein